jgi:putative ABC transport system substrate-binding protein
MRPRALVAWAVLVLAGLAPWPAEAQSAKRPWRIGALTGAWAPNHPAVEGLRASLKELGFVEGRDVVFDIRFTEGRPEAAPALAAGLVRAGADLIVTSSEDATRAASAASRTVPIVFTSVGDPVASGLVASIARPGGNVTGVSSLTTELAPKRLETLKSVAPGLRRVWVLYYVEDPGSTAAARKAAEAASLLRLEVVVQPVRSPEELARALKAVRPGDGLLAPITPALDIPGQMLETSLAGRAPAVFPAPFWTDFGALAAYGSDYHAEGVQAARLVAKILRGARPRDLPVEGADKIHLAINLRTARSLGVSVPREILLRADKVIQ